MADLDGLADRGALDLGAVRASIARLSGLAGIRRGRRVASILRGREEGPDPEGLAISALVNALRLDPDTAAEASRWMSGGDRRWRRARW